MCSQAVRRILSFLLCVLPCLLLLGAGAGSSRVIRVPVDAPSIQAAVDAAQPGDLILVEKGTYPGGVIVPSGTHDITIRGVDRNDVVSAGHAQQVNATAICA